MTLIWLIIIPLVAGIASWLSANRSTLWPRWISLTALSAEMLILLSLWTEDPRQLASSENAVWIAAIDLNWIPQLGIGFRLAMDGLSLLMVALTALLGMAAVICSWKEIKKRVGFFHFNLMVCLSGLVGVFLATDLVLFYFFWEAMLVPMYFLIGIWGHENRIYAAIKFVIFTQAGGLFMLMAILSLHFVHAHEANTYTFNYFDLLRTSSLAWSPLGLMLGFFVAFAVKLPAFPFHTWLADAHTEAPTGASVLLAGLLLKTGGYGLIRFVLPMFPEVAQAWAPVAMAIGVVGIIYGALLALAQTDLKRLIAYTSISHLGFVLLGVFAGSNLALQGAVMQMICHGITTGALFIVVGMLQERIGTRDLNKIGGLWACAPRLSAVALVFVLASLGLPGLGNFVGEFLVLVGTYRTSPGMAASAAVGLVLAVVYCLRIMGRVFYGPRKEDSEIPDLSSRETFLMAAMIAIIVWLGLVPQPVLNATEPALKAIRAGANVTRVVSRQNHSIAKQPRFQVQEILTIFPGHGSNR